MKFSKICIFDPGYYEKTLGGAEVQLFILADKLVEDGCKVVYLTGDFDEQTVYKGIEFIPFKKKKRGSILNLLYFLRKLKRVDADLYIQRGRKQETFFLGLFSYIFKKQSVFFISMDIDCDKFKFRKLWRNSRNFIKPFVVDISTSWGMKKISLIIAQTKFQQSKLKRKLSLNSVVLSNMHNLSQYQETEKDKIVLWVANMKEWKRPELFLELAQRLKNTDLKFWMIGALNTNYKNIIDRTEKENKNFKYWGSIPFDQISKYYENASVFVNTSLSNEGFPNSFIQAWASRCLVVSLSFDPDSLLHKNGFGIFCNGNFNDLQETIVKYSRDNRTAHKIIENAHNYVLNEFSIENKIKDFYDLLDKAFIKNEKDSKIPSI
ncbi:MAG: glycosyltransferase [Candidatus Lokiarchaeota archaeon]|nr:glycosyltransferase [Candidatus Lokiarchaeota archaeon]